MELNIYEYFQNLEGTLEEILKEIKIEEEKQLYKDIYTLYPSLKKGSTQKYDASVYKQCVRLFIDIDYSFEKMENKPLKERAFYSKVMSLVLKPYYKKLGIIIKE